MTFRLLRRPEDGGSLVMTMLLIMIGVSLSALLAPIAIGQVTSTRSQLRRGHTQYAAQTGLETVLGQIRAADDGSGNGVRASLPCGTLTGNVGGGTSESYQVSVYYVAFDPHSQMTAGPAWFAANDLTCTPGSGPSAVPSYAVMFSTGTEAGSSRTLRGAYRFRTTNQNIPGGRVHSLYTAASTVDLCMDTGTTITPAAGTTLRMKTCDTTRQQQVFAFNQDSTLKLVNSVTAAQPTGMCLDAGSPPIEAALVTFRPCASPATARQRWQYNGNFQFGNVDAAGAPNGFVLQLVNPNVNGSTVKITSSPASPGVLNNANGFVPEAEAGAGDAGPQNNQLVNNNQFGRCLDLTGGRADYGYMITFPCKPGWNQAYDTPPLATTLTSATPGKITLAVPAGKNTPQGLYCLRSPRSTAPGQYPAMVACALSDTTPALQWRAYDYTGNYATSYRILDVDGNCLQPTDPDAPTPDLFTVGTQGFSKIIVHPCNSSSLQKWNADPNVLASLSLQYVGEN